MTSFEINYQIFWGEFYECCSGCYLRDILFFMFFALQLNFYFYIMNFCNRTTV